MVLAIMVPFCFEMYDHADSKQGQGSTMIYQQFAHFAFWLRDSTRVIGSTPEPGCRWCDDDDDDDDDDEYITMKKGYPLLSYPPPYCITSVHEAYGRCHYVVGRSPPYSPLPSQHSCLPPCQQWQLRP